MIQKLIRLSVLCLLIIGISTATAIPALAYSTGPTNPYSFTATAGPVPGTVILHWYDDGGAVRYDIVYGTNQQQATFGQIDVPFEQYAANQDTITYLHPGTTYYFTLMGYQKDNATPYFSGPIRATAPTMNQEYGVTGTVQKSTKANPYAVSAVTGSQAGTIDLSWYDDGGAYKYDVLYGTSSNNLTFGVPNIAFIKNAENHFSVGALNPHTTYYFLLRGYVDGVGNPYLSGPVGASTK